MIELEALKEQLRLLGHGELPDDQIINILKEMNVDFSDVPAPLAPGAESRPSETHHRHDTSASASRVFRPHMDGLTSHMGGLTMHGEGSDFGAAPHQPHTSMHDDEYSSFQTRALTGSYLDRGAASSRLPHSPGAGFSHAGDSSSMLQPSMYSLSHAGGHLEEQVAAPHGLPRNANAFGDMDAINGTQVRAAPRQPTDHSLSEYSDMGQAQRRQGRPGPPVSHAPQHASGEATVRPPLDTLSENSDTSLGSEPSFAPPAAGSRQAHEWYGKLAGSCPNEDAEVLHGHVRQAAPGAVRGPQRSLLHGLGRGDEAGYHGRAALPGQHGQPRQQGFGAGLGSHRSALWEEEESDEDDGDPDDARPDVGPRRSSRDTYPQPAPASHTTATAHIQYARGPGSAAGLPGARGAWGVNDRSGPQDQEEYRDRPGYTDLEEEEDAEEEYRGRQQRGGRHNSGGVGCEDDLRGGGDVQRGAAAQAGGGGGPGSAGGDARKYFGGADSGRGALPARKAYAGGSARGVTHPSGGSNGGSAYERVHVARPATLGPADRAALKAAAAAAGAAHASSSALAGGRAKYHWHEHLRSTSPTASSIISLPRSTASTASRATSGGKPGAVRKVDRVARYQQLQQGWSKDKFLKTSQAAPTTSARQPAAAARKPVNFHSYFAVMHAIEAADRERILKETRSKTASQLKPGVEYVAPTSKRRDALRWEMRMRMQQG